MKGIVELLVLTLICGCCCKQVAEVPGKCMIIQDTRSFKAPAVPAFLTQPNKTKCQDNNNVGGLLRCGQTKVFVKRECVCTFHNVIEATHYHSYSSCPSGEESDIVTQLKCEDCKRYSLNNAGPCTNGGKPTCKGDEVAHEITCECPPNYRGPFCEEKVEKVVRICDRISNVSIEGLKNCDITWNDCVTYSRNKYAYKCNKKKLLLERQGLPLCNDTENTTVNPTTVFKIPTDRDAAKMGQSDAHNSAVGINVSLHLVGLISLTLQSFVFLAIWEWKPNMKFELIAASLLNLCPFMLLQQTEPSQCVIVQDKMSISTPREGMLRCGKSDVYIKPECVCSFHHVYDASKYHSYSSCPQGDELDVVTQLKCPDCFRYSLNNKGPCINGGNLTCKGDEVAPAITRKCPPNYQGMFCEEKMENVTRLCDRILTSSADTLMNCDYTKQECVTFSRNRRYAFKCYETDISQIKGELPLCKDTEDITVQPVVNDVFYWVVPKDATTVRVGSPSAAEIHISIPLLTVILLTLQL